MREVTGPGTFTGTISEHEMSVMAHRPKVYLCPTGGVEVQGIANVSVDEEAEVHRNVAVGEMEVAQIKLVVDSPVSLSCSLLDL